MAMYHVEMCPLKRLGLPHKINEGVTHIIHFRYEIRVQVNRAAVVMHPVYKCKSCLPLTKACKYVDLVPLSLKGSGQLGYVDGHAAYGNRMQTFPGKKCYSRFLALSNNSTLYFRPRAGDG
jgi:hypothetical protein